MLKLKKAPIILLVLFASMLLRIILGKDNGEANDNHIDVVTYILDNHRLPEKTDCWSCYQPKLYYIFSAGLIKLTGIKQYWIQIRVMQYLNVFYSLFILLFIWKFIDQQHLNDRSKYLLFAFFAFNPCLLGINIQGTNDTQAILAGITASYAFERFFSKMKFSWFMIMVLALTAGLLTKGSVITMLAVIAFVFLAKILTLPILAEKIRMIKYFILLLVFVLPLSFYAGGYYHNYAKYHDLSLSTWEKNDPPDFFRKSAPKNCRLGVRSFADAFLTFRYFDLIKQPYITNTYDNYPEHRTSWCSQLYGRTLFMHFDQWPWGWQSLDPFIISIGRFLLIIGIVPFALFMVGILFNIKELVKKAMSIDRLYFAHSLQYFYLLLTLGYLASSIIYCCTYRDFSAMKSIYIFPALLGFVKMLADGFSLLKSPRLITTAEIIFFMIVVCSICDSVFLITQLHR